MKISPIKNICPHLSPHLLIHVCLLDHGIGEHDPLGGLLVVIAPLGIGAPHAAGAADLEHCDLVVCSLGYDWIWLLLRQKRYCYLRLVEENGKIQYRVIWS